MCPPAPRFMTMVSGFHSEARTCKTWLPPARGSRDRELTDKEDVQIVLSCPYMHFFFNPHGDPGMGVCPES